MSRRDVLIEIEDMLYNNTFPDKFKVGVGFAPSYYCVAADIGDNYTLGAYVKPDYNNIGKDDILFGACGSITTGSDDPNSPLNTWVKEKLSNNFASVQPNRDGGFDFWATGSSEKFSTNNSDILFNQIMSYAENELIQVNSRIVREIAKGAKEGIQETVKRVPLTNKAKALMGIKGYSEKEATIMELHSVGDAFFKFCQDVSGLTNGNLALLTNKSQDFLKNEMKDAYKNGLLGEDGEAAYEALYAFDTDYILVFLKY